MSLRDVLKTVISDSLFISRLDRYVLSLIKEDAARRRTIPIEGFRASAADMCCRDMVYSFMGVPDDYDDETVEGFYRLAVGNKIHEMLQDLTGGMIKKGIYGVEEWFPPEQEFENTRLKIKGHLDYPVKIDGEKIIIEFKSANDRSYQKILADNKPIESHVYQSQAYMLLTGAKKVLIIYFNKNDHKRKEFLVEYDENLVHEISANITIVKRSLKNRILPERVCKGNLDAGWCKKKGICFSNKDYDGVEKMLKNGVL